jgi:hypothetical protein
LASYAATDRRAYPPPLVKARVALYEDPGEQLIIRREATRIAFVVLDFPSGSFSATAAQLAADETEHWCAAKRGSREGSSSRPSTFASCPSIFPSFPLITDPIEPCGWSLSGTTTRSCSPAPAAAVADSRHTSRAGELCVVPSLTSVDGSASSGQSDPYLC